MRMLSFYENGTKIKPILSCGIVSMSWILSRSIQEIMKL